MASPTKPESSSQDTIDQFWKTNLSSTQPPDRPSSILPNNVYAELERKRAPKGEVTGQSVVASYAEAVRECERKVAQIVAECRRNNVKYSDSHFDLDDRVYCHLPLAAKYKSADSPDDDENDDSPIAALVFDTDSYPPCAKRVGAIFDKPKFFIGGPPNVRDTRQGAEGDCWFISSLGSLCVDEENRHLVERLCPPKARDEKVGVYGFVFYRDGEWISEVVDDKLYLSTPDYDDCDGINDRGKRIVWDSSHGRSDPAASRIGFRKAFQRNSNALFYGSSADQNETWVPLMEKAFVKAHGDFKAVDGGTPGEGVEDLTGGNTTIIITADILDTDEFWDKGLLHVNKEFLFVAGTKEWSAPDSGKGRQGIEDTHAYSVLKAVKYKGQRLLMIKNPWGNAEWNGPWSDGAKEWTPEAMKELDYRFGDDGIFWMPYEDFLIRYDAVWRTRLFDSEWNVTQRWTTVQVPWMAEYNNTKFQFSIPKATRAVIVLSKLDDRYFRGLTGQYQFDISFRMHRSGEEAHLIRGYSSGSRSASVELDLEAGDYDVLLHIAATRDDSLAKVEDVVKVNWLDRREKLVQIGLAYDLAQAKGQIDLKSKKLEVISEGISAKALEEQASTTPIVDAAVPANATAPDGATVSAAFDEGADDLKPEPNPKPEPAPSIAPSIAATAGDPTEPKDDKDKPETPWNAVCVVGLKVFCHKTMATIKVVVPDPDAEEEDKVAALDVDDPEKDVAEKGGAANPTPQGGAGRLPFR